MLVFHCTTYIPVLPDDCDFKCSPMVFYSYLYRYGIGQLSVLKCSVSCFWSNKLFNHLQQRNTTCPSCDRKHLSLLIDLPYGWEQETDEKGQIIYVE